MSMEISDTTGVTQLYQGMDFLALGIPNTIHQLIQLERETYIRKPRSIRKYRNYAAGEHKLVLSLKQKQMLRHILNNNDEEFSDNVCGQIIFEARGRLKFTGWDCEDETVKDWLRDNYITSKLMDLQVDAHNSMLIDGNHVLSVNFNPQTRKIQIYQENWWDGIEGIFISYNALREPVYGVKDWYDYQRNLWRRIIWYPDRLERYIGQSNTFADAVMVNLPTDPVSGGQPIPWLDFDGTPLGIPYIHLANGFKPSGPYGRSELSGGIIGIQDQINACQWDLTGGSQMTAYQMYTATGVRMIDSNGRRISPEVGPGNFIHSPSDKARFGVLQAGDQSQLITVLNEKRSTAAAISATPLFRMVGKEWPSAEAIYRSEQPSVAKARNQIESLSPAYSSLGYVMAKIWNRFKSSNQQEMPIDIAVSAIIAKFEDPERRDQLSKSVICNNLGDSISVQEKWRIMGFSDEKIVQLYTELKQNIKDGVIANKNLKAQTGGPNPFGSQPKPQQNKIQQQQKPIHGSGG